MAGISTDWERIARDKGLLAESTGKPNRVAVGTSMDLSRFAVKQTGPAVIDLPPSTNNLFATISSGRRVKTKAYRSWIKKNALSLGLQLPRPATFPVRLEITIIGGSGLNTRRDLSNFVKPIEDALVFAGVLPDDSLPYVSVVKVSFIQRDTEDQAKAIVRIEEPEQ